MILDRSQSFTYYDLSLSKLQRCEKKTVQKNHIQRLVSLSSLSKPFKHLFSMTMKSRNLYKSWDSPGKHCSKVWGSAEISRLLIKSWGVDSPFSSTQAPTWTVWGWCEDEWESYAPSYISFLRFKYTKPQRSRCARKFCISGLDFLFFFFCQPSAQQQPTLRWMRSSLGELAEGREDRRVRGYSANLCLLAQRGSNAGERLYPVPPIQRTAKPVCSEMLL